MIPSQKAKARPVPLTTEIHSELMTFGAMRRGHGLNWPTTSSEVSLPAGVFHDLLRFALENVRFDESYYLDANVDVVEALAKGRFTDAQHHYVQFGYFEDRLPFRVEVDEAFYFEAYPDIRAAVRAGTVASAQTHFELSGFKEGRLPRENWSLPAR